MEWGVECQTGTQVPAAREFATVQMFVVVTAALEEGFSGFCQWLLETELPFSHTHSVSEQTEMYSRKYLIKRKTFTQEITFQYAI